MKSLNGAVEVLTGVDQSALPRYAGATFQREMDRKEFVAAGMKFSASIVIQGSELTLPTGFMRRGSRHIRTLFISPATRDASLSSTGTVNVSECTILVACRTGSWTPASTFTFSPAHAFTCCEMKRYTPWSIHLREGIWLLHIADSDCWKR